MQKKLLKDTSPADMIALHKRMETERVEFEEKDKKKRARKARLAKIAALKAETAALEAEPDSDY